MILQIDPALPCGALGPDGQLRCGKPATVATADSLGNGSYILLPLCAGCVAALAQLYGVAGAGAAPATEKEANE
jgi:hypothetical protein